METTARQQIRQVHDTQSEYATLNSLLQQKQLVDNQIADLLQQVAALKRKSAELDAQFHKNVISVKPSVVESQKQKTNTQNLASRIIAAMKADPSLARKLEDFDLE